MANVNHETTHTSTIETEGSYGEVKIADEVVAIIAGLAASEVKGRGVHGRKRDPGPD